VPQRFASQLRTAGSNGIVYPSLRHAAGTCLAAFWPDVVAPPVRGDRFRYHWNGARVDLVERLDGDRAVLRLP
jgi:hypothetical protein